MPLYSPLPSRLADLNAFLLDELDEAKLADLIWGLSALEWEAVDFQLPEADDDGVPFEFGVPRLLVEPRTITATGIDWRLDIGDEPDARPDPNALNILASGQPDAVGQCVDRAARRLKSGGRPVHGHRNRSLSGRSLDIRSPITAERLLASLLFPLSNRDLESIANAVLYPPISRSSHALRFRCPRRQAPDPDRSVTQAAGGYSHPADGLSGPRSGPL